MVVAAFNILASLTMVVKEKRRDIAILKSMGASSARDRPHLHPERRRDRACRAPSSATLLGLAGCWLLSRYQFVDLPKDVFLVTTLPVRIDPVNFVVVALVSIGDLPDRRAVAGAAGREPGSRRGDPV